MVHQSFGVTLSVYERSHVTSAEVETIVLSCAIKVTPTQAGSCSDEMAHGKATVFIRRRSE
jgi:hypothetical protein